MKGVFQRRFFPADTLLFREGDDGDYAFIVQQGDVEIFSDVNPPAKVIGRIGANGIFGEMALVDRQPRMASARTLADTTCILVGRSQFEQMLGEAHPFLSGLLRVLVQNVRSLSAR